jgi:hypothetical protein
MKHFIISGIAVASVITLLSGCTASDIQTLVANGEAIPTSSVKHASIPADHVKLYYASIAVPKHYQVLGHVSANNDNVMGVPHSQKTIGEELKKQAASLGANGVININTSLESTTGEAVLSK